MKRLLSFLTFMLALTLIFGAPYSFAKGKSDKGPKDSPPGWEKGEKSGWEDSGTPPGLDEEDDGEDEDGDGEDKKKKKDKKKKSKNNDDDNGDDEEDNGDNGDDEEDEDD